MSKYTPLRQEEPDSIGSGRTSTDSFEKEGPYPPASDVVTAHSTSRLYDFFIWSAVLALLLVNIGCLSMTSSHVRRVFSMLQSQLEFTDTRELPRPNPYDGTFKEGEY